MTAPVASIDPITFIEQTLVDPETGEPFVLNAAQRELLSRAFALTRDGRLKYPELVFSAPKKSGKTATAAMCVLYAVIVLGGRYAEGYCCANDFEQSQGRVFTAITRIIRASPLLASEAVITATKITFPASGATITAIASDYAGAAGANPTITSFDELWGCVSERGHRLWDEMVPPPTRKIACRLVSTYAGFSGESDLLESLYSRGLKGEQVAPDVYQQPGMLMFWTNDFIAPWQTDEWREEMRKSMRTNAYLRQIENRWVTSEATFVDLADWDACVDPAAHPLLQDRGLPVYLGVDASVKRDSTAIVACTYDRAEKRVRLVYHKVFQPSPDDPLDFEHTIEHTVEELAHRFRVRECRYDPYQMQASAQRLTARGINMVEFAQHPGNLTEASSNLYELIRGHNLSTYFDGPMRLAIQRSVAVETPRGWRIAKEKQSHKIDVVIALGMAALGAVSSASRKAPMQISDDFLQKSRTPQYYRRFNQGNIPWHL